MIASHALMPKAGGQRATGVAQEAPGFARGRAGSVLEAFSRKAWRNAPRLFWCVPIE